MPLFMGEHGVQLPALQPAQRGRGDDQSGRGPGQPPASGRSPSRTTSRSVSGSSPGNRARTSSSARLCRRRARARATSRTSIAAVHAPPQARATAVVAAHPSRCPAHRPPPPRAAPGRTHGPVPPPRRPPRSASSTARSRPARPPPRTATSTGRPPVPGPASPPGRAAAGRERRSARRAAAVPRDHHGPKPMSRVSRRDTYRRGKVTHATVCRRAAGAPAAVPATEHDGAVRHERLRPRRGSEREEHRHHGEGHGQPAYARQLRPVSPADGPRTAAAVTVVTGTSRTPDHSTYPAK